MQNKCLPVSQSKQHHFDLLVQRAMYKSQMVPDSHQEPIKIGFQKFKKPIQKVMGLTQIKSGLVINYKRVRKRYKRFLKLALFLLFVYLPLSKYIAQNHEVNSNCFSPSASSSDCPISTVSLFLPAQSSMTLMADEKKASDTSGYLTPMVNVFRC